MRNMNRIEIAIYPGFDEVDAVGPFEVLSNVTQAHPELDVELVGAHGPGEIVAGHGMRVVCAEGMSDAADLIVVPGGGWVRGGGVREQYEQGTLADRLRGLHNDGVAMASVCTGGILLAQAGILDGRPATTHHAALDHLAEMGAHVDRQARVVDDGDVLTCGGVTSGLDLAFHLIEREWGPELAEQIATLMEHQRRGPVRISSSPTSGYTGTQARPKAPGAGVRSDQTPAQGRTTQIAPTARADLRAEPRTRDLLPPRMNAAVGGVR
jgi:transcriptional regulator GlxA family with amidase domain